MFGRKNFRVSGWHLATLFAMLALALGLGLTAGGAFAGRLTDTTAGLPSKVVHPANPGGTDLVISQIYGGGGNTGAPWQNDFIEVFNPTTGPISVAGWSVQYGAATGSTWQVTTITGTIPSGGYYLVQEAGGVNGIPLPTPDATGTISMSGTAGKVALVNTTTALIGACPTGATIVDFVGYGSAANCFEGSGPTVAPSNTSSVVRQSGGCTDTNNNVSDFVGSPTITPRNSASPHTNCQGTPTSTPSPIPTCGTGADYAIFPSTGATLVPGVTDIGNHCSSCTTLITLPFAYNLYGVSRTTANVSVNGTLQFNSASGAFTNTCLPTASFSDAILPYWDGLNTTVGITTTITPGIYTSISGSAPNRIFNIEWRTCVFEGTGTTCNRGLAIFETRLYEGLDRFDVVYDTVEAGGSFATIGVQRGAGTSYTQYSCNLADLSAGLQLEFRPYNCGEITNTPTVTSIPTNTFTPTSTRTTTPTGTATITPGGPTLTPTNTLTPTATHPPSNSVVISEFRTRGLNGGNDEFIELYNKTGSPVDVSGWKINGSAGGGITVTNRLIISPSTTIPAYGHFLATNSLAYTGTVAGDQTYSTGISDNGGIGLLNPSDVVIDAAGMDTATTYYEGTPLPPFTSTANYDHSYERLIGGSGGNAVDTNNNLNDFFLNPSSSNPQNLNSPPVPPCPPVTMQNDIQGFAFIPQSMTISQGTTVHWTNLDNAAHTSTSDTGIWDSGSLVQNDSFSYTFNGVGTFTYHCDIHPSMTGSITVIAGCAPAATPTNTPVAPTNTPTNTPPPSGTINGHLTWQGIAAANRPLVTGTLTLCVTGAPQAYSFNTDTNGNFTVTTGLPDGSYNWQVKGGRHITSAGLNLIISGGTATQEFGTQKGGNTNTDNIINSTDFNALKTQFGQSGLRSADFDYNLVVNASDFNIQKANFGQAGAPLVCP